MNREEFKQHMREYRSLADERAAQLKNPYYTLEKLHSLYEGLSPENRLVADSVLSEWALSDDETLRFDAMDLIDDYGIESAVPALRALIERLRASTAPGAPLEAKKAERIIAGIKRRTE